MTTHLVSIIIPTYNRAHLIHETLNSVLAQTYENWECVVVDDGSEDETEVVVKHYLDSDDRFKYYRRPESHLAGGNGARNYGFLMSKGDYIQWFDDDDVMLPEFLERKIKVFSPKLDLVICTGFKTDTSLVKHKIISLFPTNTLFKDYALKNIRVLTPSVLFKKSFLADKELFSTKIHRGQETELFLRLFYQLEPARYVIIDEPLFLYRQHASTKSEQSKHYNSRFIEGQSWIFVQTLKKGIALRDKDIVLKYYRLLLNYFYTGLTEKHHKNGYYILSELLKNLGVFSVRFKIELRFVGNFHIYLSKKPMYRVRKYFLHHHNIIHIFEDKSLL